MNLTILFDLDDTLLKNDIDVFLRAYLHTLSEHVQGLPPGLLVSSLLAATQKMIEHRVPDCTLETVFDQHFYPAIGISKEDMAGEIASYYRDVFPSLRSLTQPRPAALRLLQYALDQGYQVAIATNPLFPREASLQRVAWAGIQLEQTPIRLVTTYEDFHFTKPHPSYYAEVLARCGWPDHPAVMIGNSLEDDIRPANRLGLPAYWVQNQEPGETASLPELSSAGPLENALDWLKGLEEKEFALQYDQPDSLVAVLASTPAVLDSWASALSPEEWRHAPAPGEWSTTEVVWHLHDVECEVNLPRIHRLLHESRPFFPGEVTDVWAAERNYAAQ
ncbi:MAG: HAD hydrolase-like protein, partial [Chloroflexi bacterium]|nr:HAD hydrolase-like protein [Chloroflexota bacterium]